MLVVAPPPPPAKNLELLKELNVPGDTFFIELAYKIMGDIEISQEELVEKNLEKFKNLTPILLSYLQILLWFC